MKTRGGREGGGGDIPSVKVVPTVVVITDLLLVLGGRVHDDFGDEIEEDVFEEFGGHMERSPVMTGLHNLQHIA